MYVRPLTLVPIAVLAVTSLAAARVQDVPAAPLSGEAIDARVWVPDAARGYYRGTRFDWSGAIASLLWHGHTYFGQWFPAHDPLVHDAITGPVEEFLTDGAGLGYAEAKAGEPFVRIGVGSVRKPDEPAYRQFHTYEIVDPGRRTFKSGRDWAEFTHTLGDVNGYAYEYRKRIALDRDRMTIEHHLKNTGRKAIASSVYAHDFFMLDNQPTGPSTVIRFAFDPRTASPLDPLAELRGRELVYLRDLTGTETVHAEITGFGKSAKDYDIRVENQRTGAAVRQTADRPLSKLVVWSPRTTVCPEAYIDLRIEPGREASWTITYEFYSVRGS